MADYASLGMCWGKLRRECREGRGTRCRTACSCKVTGSLSLVGHCADVAAVLLALLERPVIRQRLARLAGWAELTPQDRMRLAALGALHDIGKISQGFQRAPFENGQRERGHVAPLLSLFKNERCDPRAARALQGLYESGGLACFAHLIDGAAEEIFEAVLAHHGSLPQAGPSTPQLWQPVRGYDPVRACRDLVDAIAAWFPEAVDPEPVRATRRFAHAFAGLLTLADWLGSDDTVFRMAGQEGAPDGLARFDWSLPKARALLEARLLAPERARAACAPLRWEIDPLFGFSAASAAQDAMLSLSPAPIDGRTCLIEDETGSGKTEAALIHFLRLFEAGAVEGMYFALPTRAAAVQIHRRIERALKRLLGEAAPAVILAVPGYLGPERNPGAQLPDESSLWPEEKEHDARWASTRPKRYLAACVAVGTIDQALMGGLQVRHAQLRSGVMLRLLLVVDEVHASDVYMTAILRNLLDQHRQAGGHALLMSATLGRKARARKNCTVASCTQCHGPDRWRRRTSIRSEIKGP